jgi:hypothetical protein
MIPRTLVPAQLAASAMAPEADTPRRTRTELDHRTLVIAGTEAGPIETASSIPSHVPLDVLSKRVLVPKDLPPLPADALRPTQALNPTPLDHRVAIPQDARPAALEMHPRRVAEQTSTLLDPDVLTTGDVNLLVGPREVRPPLVEWRVAVPSFLVHAALVLLILLQPKMFPYEPPEEKEIEQAHRLLGLVYIPPEARVVPAPVQPAPPAPQIRIDPRLFRENAPPTDREITIPGPPTPEPSPRGGDARDDSSRLPAAPQPSGGSPAERERERGNEVARLESPRAPEPRPGAFTLPPASPGRIIEETARGALEGRGGSAQGFDDTIPARPGGGGTPGGGQGYLGGTVQMLTPTEGVDFSNYLARVLASVRRNWYAVIPESARLGERGMVVIQFRIMRSGQVPYPEPNLVATSGREPLDRAAMASISASNPFEPLPSAFSGPYIELRFIFLYNMRLPQ